MLDEMEALIRKRIINWYTDNGRDFAWRHTKDPYSIMIAEFMLHRTRADQVVPIYCEFIMKYPNLSSLVAANKREIRKVTQHLGLHWRSDHFIKAAKFIVDNCGGKYPENREKLLKVPGIGEYIAGAILAVCFKIPGCVVDSNIARFVNRFYGFNLEGEIRRKKRIVEKAGDLFKCNKPGELLFALVDFTSIICKPLTPQCDMCPLNDCCKYFKKISLNSEHTIRSCSLKPV